jgi:hypothetical protein
VPHSAHLPICFTLSVRRLRRWLSEYMLRFHFIDLLAVVMKQFFMALIFVVPLSANAVLIDTSIGTYDVTYRLTTGLGLLDPGVPDVPWLGNGDLTDEFVTLVGDRLGFPNDLRGTNCAGIFFETVCGAFGPFFIAGKPPYTILVASTQIVAGDGIETFLPSGIVGFNYAFARNVTPIPEPSTVSLLGTGLLGLGLRRSRRRAV